ncbi:uncharacterized protein UTRI_01869_B [Ustilago trichophora]|uniref:Uncharacterized protein n=1 Tax=Ustilago trichophora TaxID=86804 RepID=A0A5C3DXT3_9BASI|nr:uncharacterized protein UTRI_01869_B [Ustilago trichophora]
MKSITFFLPLVAAAVTCSAASIESGSKQPTDLVKWRQTKSEKGNSKVPPTQQSGALGSSVQGYFPKMSKQHIGMGCGIDWEEGQIHAGFDGGDKDNGVGGGFQWMPHSLGSNLGVHYRGTVVNLNLTITDQNQIIFKVGDKFIDWNKVLQAEIPPPPGEGSATTKPYHLGNPVDLVPVAH